MLALFLGANSGEDRSVNEILTESAVPPATGSRYFAYLTEIGLVETVTGDPVRPGGHR